MSQKLKQGGFKDFQALLYKFKDFQGLEFSFSNSRTFKDFQVLYEPVSNKNATTKRRKIERNDFI